MRRIVAVVLGLALCGCLTQEELNTKREAARGLIERVRVAEQAAVVTCTGKEACDKSWRVTKAYIQETAMMKVQFSDDTTIFTYRPTEYAYTGMSATRKPGAGDSESIRLEIVCDGTQLGEGWWGVCGPRMIAGYEGFRNAHDALSH